MRMFIAVVMVLVLTAPVSLADDSSKITRLERKLAKALRTIQALEKAVEKDAKAAQALEKQNEELAKVLEKDIKAGEKLLKKLLKGIDTLNEKHEALEKDVRAARKREKELLKVLDLLDEKVSALANFQMKELVEREAELREWVTKKALGFPPYRHGFHGPGGVSHPGRGANAYQWMRHMLDQRMFVHEHNLHGRR